MVSKENPFPRIKSFRDQCAKNLPLSVDPSLWVDSELKRWLQVVRDFFTL